MDSKIIVIGLLILVVIGLVLVMGGFLNISPGGGEESGPSFTRPDIKPGSGSEESNTGGKQLGDSGSVAKPVDEDRNACQDACDDDCKNEINDCSDDCATSHTGTCTAAQLQLNNCNFGCFNIPIKPPGPGPDPRDDCFDMCMNNFEAMCDNNDLVDCQEDCQSGQQSCQKECYGGC